MKKTNLPFVYNTKIIETLTTKEIYFYEKPIYSKSDSNTEISKDMYIKIRRIENATERGDCGINIEIPESTLILLEETYNINKSNVLEDIEHMNFAEIKKYGNPCRIRILVPINSEASEVRTPDNLIKSQVLYQLS